MPAFNFEEVRITRRKTGKCVHCKRRVTRSQTFTNTVNPFNKTPEGEVKTREQVRSDVCTEANRWSDAPMSCGCYKVGPHAK